MGSYTPLTADEQGPVAPEMSTARAFANRSFASLSFRAFSSRAFRACSSRAACSLAACSLAACTFAARAFAASASSAAFTFAADSSVHAGTIALMVLSFCCNLSSFGSKVSLSLSLVTKTSSWRRISTASSAVRVPHFAIKDFSSFPSLYSDEPMESMVTRRSNSADDFDSRPLVLALCVQQ